MGQSWNTEPEFIQAARRIGRSTDGNRQLPPIVTRKPRRGDHHAVSPSQLNAFLGGTPTEYLYGLRRIELQPRASETIGEPFGCYRFAERTIVLYSLPPTWAVPRLTSGWESNLTSYGAIVDRDGGVVVSWPGDSCLKLWFWDTVVMHELGHHFVEQYKSKNGRVRSQKAHEALAELHKGRYLSKRWQRMKLRLEEST